MKVEQVRVRRDIMGFMVEKQNQEIDAALSWSAKIQDERTRANRWMAAAIVGWFFALGIAWAWWMLR